MEIDLQYIIFISFSLWLKNTPQQTQQRKIFQHILSKACTSPTFIRSAIQMPKLRESANASLS